MAVTAELFDSSSRRTVWNLLTVTTRTVYCKNVYTSSHFSLLKIELLFLLLIPQYFFCWQLSIWNCCKPFFSLLYSRQLLCFWRLVLSTLAEVFTRQFFPNIAPSSMFTTNSLRLTVCPISLTVCPISLTVCPISLIVCPISLTVCPISLTVCPVSLTVFPMHECHLLLNIFKSNLSSCAT